MPHGWRFAARSTVSPSACASTDPSGGLGASITGAFVDRTPIDWTALLKRARDPDERASLEALWRLDDLRGGSRPASAAPEPFPRAAVLRILLAVGILQTTCGLANAAAAA